MTRSKLFGSGLAAAVAMLFTQGAQAQEIVPLEPPAEANLIGLGVFATPDYYGSENNDAAFAPILRWSFGQNQYLQVLGPEAQLNLVPRTDFRAGPLLRFRARRDDDVDDELVQRMRPIATATELGAFAAWHMPLDASRPQHKVVFHGDVVWNTNDVYTGASGNVRATYHYPFQQAAMGGRPMVGTIGLGLFWASDHFNRRYFGVTGSDVVLFPELGGREYSPEGGIASIKIPAALTVDLGNRWLLTVAGRWEHLLEDAKDSPVVGRRGDENQWTFGVAASYQF